MLDPDAKEALKIIAATLVAAVTFGFLHDSVTARISLSYFTVGHDMPFETTNPNIIALYWGFMATWWLALPLGIGIAAAALAGRRPQLAWRDLVRPLALLVLLGLLISWAVGANAHFNSNPAQWADHEYGDDPARANFVCYQMHTASYLSMPLLAVGLCVLTVRRRRRLARQNH